MWRDRSTHDLLFWISSKVSFSLPLFFDLLPRIIISYLPFGFRVLVLFLKRYTLDSDTETVRKRRSAVLPSMNVHIPQHSVFAIENEVSEGETWKFENNTSNGFQVQVSGIVTSFSVVFVF